MRLNHPKLVQKHPAHLVYPVKIIVREGSVYSNHPELMCETTLQTLLSLQ